MKDGNGIDYIKMQEQELLQLLTDLARIPAPSGREERRAAFCLKWLHSHGAEDAYIDAAGNVVYLYGKSNPLIVFDAHMDVVFPDETELPLYEQDGRIYCPGVGDDTANLAVLLMTAAYAAQNQPDTGEYGVLFVCSVGEEGLGNLKGVRKTMEDFGEQIAAYYSFDLHLNAYTCRAVGSIRYRIEVETQGGHSYGCFGNTNANAVLAELITALYQIKVPEYGKTTYNVGMISGGTSVNTIAQKAEMLYEIRSDDHRGMLEVKRRFEEILCACQKAYQKKDEPESDSVNTGILSSSDAKISVELIGERPCEKDVDEKKRDWLFAQTERIIEDVTGSVPEGVPCSTNCNIPLSMGIPSVCLGMCSGAGAHTREEYIEKDSLKVGLQAALRLLEEVKRIYA